MSVENVLQKIRKKNTIVKKNPTTVFTRIVMVCFFSFTGTEVWKLQVSNFAHRYTRLY